MAQYDPYAMTSPDFDMISEQTQKPVFDVYGDYLLQGDSRTQQQRNEDNLRFDLVDTPIRLGKNFVRGAAEGVADLISLPEELVNRLGEGLLWDEEQKFNVLHSIGESIKDVAPDVKPKYLEDKLFNMIGYMIPDLVGISLSGAGAASLAAKGATYAGRTITPFARAAARVAGHIGYGAMKGGIEGAREFTAMEIANSVFGRYSKPVQVVGNAVFMGSMAAAMGDERNPEYQTDIAANTIMGGMFGLLGPKGKRSISRDAVKTTERVRQWIKGDGVGQDAVAYVDQFASLSYRSLLRSRESYKYYENARDDLIGKYKELTGDTRTEYTNEQLKTGLSGLFLKEGVPAKESEALAHGFVQAADFIQNPAKYGQGEFDVDIATRGMASILPDRAFQKELPVDTSLPGRTIVNKFGQEQSLTEGEYSAWKRRELEDKLRLEKEIQIYNKEQLPLDARAKKISDKITKALFQPEGKLLESLEKLTPKEVKRVKASKSGGVVYETTTIDGKTLYDSTQFLYNVRSTIDARVEDVLVRSRLSGPEKMSETEYKLFESQIDAIVMRNHYDRGGKKSARRQEMTYEDTNHVIKTNEDTIRQALGEEGLTKFRDSVESYFDAFQVDLYRQYAAGLISKGQLQRLEGTKYAPQKLLKDLEEIHGRSEMLQFLEQFGTKYDVAHLKESAGEVRITDPIYRLESHLVKTGYVTEKNAMLRDLFEVAPQRGDPESLGLDFLKEEHIYRSKETGKEVSGKELVDIREHNKMIDKAKRAKKVLSKAKKALTEKEPLGTSDSLVIKRLIKASKTKIEKLESEAATLKKKYEHLESLAGKSFDELLSAVKIPERKQIGLSTPAEVREYKSLIERETLLRAEVKEAKAATKLHTLERVPANAPMRGFMKIKLKVDGKPEEMWVNETVASLISQRTTMAKGYATTLKWIGRASGVRLVKEFAVGKNPVFATSAVLRDLKFFYLTNPNEKGNLLSYMKESLPQLKRIINEIRKNEGSARTYWENGGSALTKSRMEIAELINRRRSALVGSSDPTLSGKLARGWLKANQVLSAPGHILEQAVRVNAMERMIKSGMSPRKAVATVNQQLNFSRKGSILRVVDEIVPFANVTGQVLDSYWRAFKADRGLMAKKMAQYHMARVALISAGYLIGSEAMDQISPKTKIGNIVLPLGHNIITREGERSHGYMTIPVEKNPASVFIDGLIYAAFDKLRGVNTESQWLSIINPLGKEITAFDVGDSYLPPMADALLAAYANVDPMTKDSIWKGDPMVNLEARYYTDTSGLAKGFGKVVGAAPVGVEKAARVITANNPVMNFFGYMLRDLTYEEREFASKAITELPGVSRFFRYTHEQTQGLKDAVAEETTARKKLVSDNVRYLVDQVKDNTLSLHDAKRSIRGYGFNSLETKEAEKHLARSLKGHIAFEAVQARFGTDIINEIPGIRLWQQMVGASPKSKARFYLSNVPQRGTIAYKAFRSVAKGHGFDSSQFQFYKRRLERGIED